MKSILHFILPALFLLLVSPSTAQQRISTPKPNVLVIIADDQGWGDLGFNGNKTASTPHLDQLAKSGVVLDRFYVSPVCSPTRAEFLTGRYHVRSGVSGTSTGRVRLDLDESTITEAFKNAGYRTALFGKWHNGGQAPYHPNCRGIDEFYGFCSGHWGNYFNPVLEHNGEIIKGNGFITDDLTKHAIDYVNSPTNQPFFVIMALNTPHSPMQVPEEFWNRYKDKQVTQRGSIPDKEDLQHTRAASALNENLDENVGKLLQELKDKKQLENTIVIYFSDNGPNGNRWNGEMKGIKGSVDEGGVRVPFIIRWDKKIKGGRKIAQISANIDLFPTLMDLADISWKNYQPFDGISLKNLLLEKKPTPIDRIIPSFWSNETSVRSPNFRLSNKDELFDMIHDPQQTKNVASVFPKEFQRLKNWKDEWIQHVRSELPKDDARPLIVGDLKMKLTKLPASEAEASGSIVRSSKHPNDSYFKGWTNENDKITWNIEVASDGWFEVQAYIACSEKNVGSILEVKFNEVAVENKIVAENNAPLLGMEHDKVVREESYVKDFKPMKLGMIQLKKGKGLLELYSKKLLQPNDLECNLITLRRVTE
ncbi:MAG: hypothetical protein RLY11_137 [Bacteroidota bacterium]|jgi:arylsulfatase A-like enzyme